MPTAGKPPPPKSERPPVVARSIYRGVPLQATKGRSRFTTRQITRAVLAAVLKNADAITGPSKG